MAFQAALGQGCGRDVGDEFCEALLDLIALQLKPFFRGPEILLNACERASRFVGAEVLATPLESTPVRDPLAALRFHRTYRMQRGSSPSGPSWRLLRISRWQAEDPSSFLGGLSVAAKETRPRSFLWFSCLNSYVGIIVGVLLFRDGDQHHPLADQ